MTSKFKGLGKLNFLRKFDAAKEFFNENLESMRNAGLNRQKEEDDVLYLLYNEASENFRDFSAAEILNWHQKIERLFYAQGYGKEYVWEMVRRNNASIVSDTIIAVTHPEQVQALVDVFPVSAKEFASLMGENIDHETLEHFEAEVITQWLKNHKNYIVAAKKQGLW